MSEIVRQLAERFWDWYERHYALHVGIALVLFLWQLVHLYWLGADVIAVRLFGVSYFEAQGWWRILLIVVDYTEIPAIVSTSLLYIFELRQRMSWKILGLLLLLNSQWFHLFWITDEFIEEVLTGRGAGTVLPVFLAWVAILIDYLELPVILDVVFRFIRALRQGRGLDFMRKEVR